MGFQREAYNPKRVGGGRDQFTWDDVKTQNWKDREQYLGQSLVFNPHAPWKLDDVSNEKEAINREKEEARKLEEELMRQALGLAPRTKVEAPKRQLEKHELDALFAKGSGDRTSLGIDRIEGLGREEAPRHYLTGKLGTDSDGVDSLRPSSASVESVSNSGLKEKPSENRNYNILKPTSSSDQGSSSDLQVASKASHSYPSEHGRKRHHSSEKHGRDEKAHSRKRHHSHSSSRHRDEKTSKERHSSSEDGRHRKEVDKDRKRKERSSASKLEKHVSRAEHRLHRKSRSRSPR